MEVSSAFESQVRTRAEAAIVFGLTSTAENLADVVEVHARAARPRRSWRIHLSEGTSRSFARRRDAVAFRERHGGEITVHDRHSQVWITGRAYDGVPGIARVSRGVRYLVTLKIPIDAAGWPPERYPRTWRYTRYATAPAQRFTSWEEELVHASAHEGRHIRQFATGLPRSEIDAEHAACAALRLWRERGADAVQIALF